MCSSVAGFEYSCAAGLPPAPFDFKNVSSRLEQATRPPLASTAPELARGAAAMLPISSLAATSATNDLMAFDGNNGAGGGGGAPGGSCPSDVFSLATLAYRLLAGRELLRVSEDVNALADYHTALAAVAGRPLVGAPPALEPLLRRMLSPSPAARPAAAELAAAGYFRDSRPLRALRFLDSLLQHGVPQRVAFWRDLRGMWADFDSTLLRRRCGAGALRMPQSCASPRRSLRAVWFEVAANRSHGVI